MTFIQNLEWRHATKKFDGKKVPDEMVEKILDSVRMAPTSFGLQPFHVTVVTSDELKATLQAHAYNKEQVTTCSHFLVFSADTNLAKRADEYLTMAGMKHEGGEVSGLEKVIKEFITEVDAEWAVKQAYIALGFAMAACAELQIDSCPMEGFDPEEFKKALGLPENLNPKVALPIGYRTADYVAVPKIRFSKEDLFDSK